ncbi:MAG: HEAT repeat domain-containing protein [Deltaproteobacteria bacterium]|nr:HEAT repeat domain-containing protein [Deltaproteobacteria bacterium]
MPTQEMRTRMQMQVNVQEKDRREGLNLMLVSRKWMLVAGLFVGASSFGLRPADAGESSAKSARGEGIVAPVVHPPRVLQLLGLIDQFIDKAQLIEAGADAAGDTLVRIVDDANLPAYTRIRAAAYLGAFDSKATRARLHRLVFERTIEPLEVRIQAMRSMTLLEGPGASKVLAVLLEDEQSEVRASAARLLGKLGEKEILRKRLAGNLEQDPYVRSVIVAASSAPR